MPIELAINSELRGRLIEAMKQSPDKAREGEVALFGVENNLKRTIGRTRALGDPAFSAMLAKNEAELRAKSARQCRDRRSVARDRRRRHRAARDRRRSAASRARRAT